MRFLNPILVVLVSALPVLAQTSRFSFGAIGGVRLSSGAPEDTHDESPRYTVGADFEASFGNHLAVEVDALYKRFGYSYVITETLSGPGFPPEVDLIAVTRIRANSVEFPILGKYYFGRRNPRGRFFVDTGYSFQRSWVTATTGVVQSPCCVNIASPGGAEPPVEVGAVFGAGVTRKMGALTIAPTFRYTRWGYQSDGASPNQLEILLSLRI
jgi:hypothetical protein